jgi:hypothetical protein
MGYLGLAFVAGQVAFFFAVRQVAGFDEYAGHSRSLQHADADIPLLYTIAAAASFGELLFDKGTE